MKNSEHYQQLMQTRQTIVQQLTELNSRYIRSQAQLAGFELHINRYREAMQQGDISDATVAEISNYEQEIDKVEVVRAEIDQSRDTLTIKLEKLEQEIQDCL